MSIDQLKPAPKDLCIPYTPYYQGEKRNILPRAISLYQQASLEGHRKIEGGESIPFVATWMVYMLPSDLTRCRLQFDVNAELNYEIMMQNSDFVDFLIDVIRNYDRTREVDFSKEFYRKLLNVDE